MSNMFCFAADCILREDNWINPDDKEQCAIWPTNPRDWYDIRTELPYMAEIGIPPSNDCAVQHCLTITRTPCEWDSTRMKNWRDMYPAL